MTSSSKDQIEPSEDDQDQAATTDEQEPDRKRRVVRNFPALSFEECEAFAAQVYRLGSGNPVRRLTLFGDIGRSPDSSASRALITGASKYGLTKGSYKADQIELTATGLKCVADDTSIKDRITARFQAAIEAVAPFRGLYEQNINLKRPANSALADAVQAFGVTKDAAEEAVETFVVNLRHVGLLKNVSGAERILALEHVLDELPSDGSPVGKSPGTAQPSTHHATTAGESDFEKTCFYITPIGSDDSEQRRHSDLFLSSIVEPALSSLGMSVVRADKIQKAGSITRQVIEYVIRSRLVVADLSFHNPNVFYELAVRHITRKPVVQIVRKGDGVPFDINQQRTIEIDNSSIYELVPMLETYRASIASHARAALDNPDVTDNPIATYFPAVGMLGI